MNLPLKNKYNKQKGKKNDEPAVLYNDMPSVKLHNNDILGFMYLDSFK